MVDCRKCRHNYKPPTCEPKCNRLCDGESDFKPKTNADKIRSMSDEELAELFTKLAWNSEVQTTPLKYLDWLQSEVE